VAFGGQILQQRPGSSNTCTRLPGEVVTKTLIFLLTLFDMATKVKGTSHIYYN
jgi:hypothetical protein